MCNADNRDALLNVLHPLQYIFVIVFDRKTHRALDVNILYIQYEMQKGNARVSRGLCGRARLGH